MDRTGSVRSTLCLFRRNNLSILFPLWGRWMASCSEDRCLAICTSDLNAEEKGWNVPWSSSVDGDAGALLTPRGIWDGWLGERGCEGRARGSSMFPPLRAISLVLLKSSRATGRTGIRGCWNASFIQPFHVGSDGMNWSTSSSNFW